MELRVLHEDPDLLAVDKPPGLLVVPGRTGEGPCLRDWAAARSGRLWVVHRLDKDTSGVVLLAKNPEAHRALSLAFERREVEKVYLALVRGEPPGEEGVIELPLRPGRKGRTVVAEPGYTRAKPSVTRWRVMERLGLYALMEVRPQTGRAHQIRVHLAACGMPLAVDPLYARQTPGEARAQATDAGALGLSRTPLHAASLDVPHPRGGRLRVQASVPEDLRAAIAAARAAGSRG